MNTNKDVQVQDQLVCPVCDEEQTLDSVETISACPGNFFCSCCLSELRWVDMLPSLLCGKCESCLDLKREGDFTLIQRHRQQLLDSCR